MQGTGQPPSGSYPPPPITPANPAHYQGQNAAQPPSQQNDQYTRQHGGQYVDGRYEGQQVGRNIGQYGGGRENPVTAHQTPNVGGYPSTGGYPIATNFPGGSYPTAGGGYPVTPNIATAAVPPSPHVAYQRQPGQPFPHPIGQANVQPPTGPPLPSQPYQTAQPPIIKTAPIAADELAAKMQTQFSALSVKPTGYQSNVQQAPQPYPQHMSQPAPVGLPLNRGLASQPAGPVYEQLTNILGQPPQLNQLREAKASPILPPLNPAYFRLTLPKVPKTQAILNKTRLPLGLTVTPYPLLEQDNSVPVIDGLIVRCRRCRTYLNPFVELVEQGSKWRCNLCYLVNDFPPNFDYDVASQSYTEKSHKAELRHAIYEFVAPDEYTARPPQPPVYLFVIDVSHGAVSRGLVATLSKVLTEALDQIPNSNGRTRIGIISVDSAIHFYNLAGQSEEPRIMVVPDLDDPFLPSVDDLLVPLTEARPQIERIFAKLNRLFCDTQNPNSALGPALIAALKLIGPVGGKIVVMQSTLPNLGDGKLTGRDDLRVLGTNKESSQLQSANSFYKSFATDCSKAHVCVDLFLFPAPSLDIATLGCAARFTGGKIFLYPEFNASSSEQVESFAGDLVSFLGQEIGLEAVIRIRASQGITLNSYFGSFFLRSTDLLSLPNVNLRHSYTAQLTIDENLTAPMACFQTAVLHTSCHGERRIRVINAAFPVTESHSEAMTNTDVGALADLIFKMSAEKAVSNGLEAAREAINHKMNEVLNAVKATYQQGGGMSQLAIPASLQLFPVLLLAMQKSIALRGGNYTLPDLRSYHLALCKTLSVAENLYLLYPYLFAVHTMSDTAGIPHPETGAIVLPPALHLSSEVLERHGLYVLDNGQDIYIWVGSQLHPQLSELMFGTHNIPTGRASLPHLENEWSRRLANILGKLREIHGNHPGITIIKDDSQPLLKSLFLNFLIEDKLPDGLPSYPAWLASLRDRMAASSR